MNEQLEQDIKNLEVVFAIARKEVALDEAQLIELIKLKGRIIDLITPKEEKAELKVEK